MTVTLEPDVMVEDASIWPAMTALISCLCSQLQLDGLPPVCICSPMPGEAIATDYVSEDAGMAWVRLVQAWPSTSFPAVDPGPGCGAPLAFGLELGVAYCAPGPDEDGGPPDLVAQFEATRLQVAAMNTMRRAIACCFPNRRAADVVLATYAPMGPEGGVVGGAWTLTVAQGALR